MAISESGDEGADLVKQMMDAYTGRLVTDPNVEKNDRFSMGDFSIVGIPSEDPNGAFGWRMNTFIGDPPPDIEDWMRTRRGLNKSSANAYDIMYIPTTEEDIRDNVRQHMADSGVSPNYYKFFKTPNNEVYLWNIAPNKNTSYDYDGFPSHADMVEKVKGFNPYDNFDMVDEADGYDFG
jgi:hypothetical protein